MAFKDKLQEYALLAEIISAVAIVTSLIFVGLQIQQNSEETSLNTRASSANAYQQIIAQVLNMNEMLAENPELEEIVRKAENGEPLSTLENRRYIRIFASMWRIGDTAFNMYRQGIIDEAGLISSTGIFSTQLVQSEVARALWEVTPDSEYKAFMANQLEVGVPVIFIRPDE